MATDPMEQMQDQLDPQDPNQQQPQPEGEGNLLEDDILSDAAFDRFRENGKLNVGKMAKSYRALEKKMGSGDVAPDDVDGYGEVTDLEGAKLDPERLKAFRDGALKVGMTKKQMEYVMSSLGQTVKEGMELQSKQAEMTKKEAENKLKSAWGDKYEENLTLARKAFFAVADEDDIANIDKLGKSPEVLIFLAKRGAKMREDSPASEMGGVSLPQEELASLMKSEAYFNKKHPEHDKVKKQVTEFFQKKYKA